MEIVLRYSKIYDNRHLQVQRVAGYLILPDAATLCYAECVTQLYLATIWTDTAI
jgi:hypothetical protein